MDDNDISEIPKEVGNLTDLEVLKKDDNNINDNIINEIMKDKDLIQEYESKVGKKAIVDGKKTIGFKRWKQQHKSDSKLDDVISTFRDKFRKDVKDIVKIYLEKANINQSQRNILKYLKKYLKLIFPSKVTYKGKSFKIDSDGILILNNLDIKDLQNVKGLFKLHFLKSLYIQNNKISKIPKEFGNLTNLRGLYMDDNNISEIPKEFSNLKKLKVLSMENNNFTMITKEVCNLSNLETLKMRNNEISEIPKSVEDLRNLRRLWIAFNWISEIPKEVGSLGNLNSLFLKGNNISIIPKEIGNLKNLDYINLDGNIISKIPKEFGNLTNLEYFNISYNNISEIPKEISNLTSLKEIKMFNNNLKSLPKEMGDLKNLEKIGIKGNNISKNNIPKTILNNEDIRLLL